MDISKAMLEERLSTLKDQRDQCINNANAFTGAIQDCEYWLGVLSKEGNNG